MDSSPPATVVGKRKWKHTTPPLQPSSESESGSMDSNTPRLPPNYFNLQNVELLRATFGLQLPIAPDLLPELTNTVESAVGRPPEDDMGKQKASNFTVTSISIGPNWRRESRRVGDLTAKLYFGRKKLIWEFLERVVKVKIEVCWSDITAINIRMPHHQPGFLRIELDKTPKFFREIPPRQGKHSKWEPMSDFTDGHALRHRIHEAEFPHGELDEHYLKLLRSDQRLLELSKNPFLCSHLGLGTVQQQSHLSNLNNPTPSIHMRMGESSRNADINHHHNTARAALGSENRVYGGETDHEQWPQENMGYSNNIYGGVTAPRSNNICAGVTTQQLGSNLYVPELVYNNICGGATADQQPRLYVPELVSNNIYGGVTAEQHPDLGYGRGVTEEQWPELGFTCIYVDVPELGYGGVTAEQQRPEFDGDGNIGNNMHLDNIADQD